MSEPKTELGLISIDFFRINSTPAVVSANFGEMRNRIVQLLEDKKSLVVPENIQQSKVLIADFRKTSKALVAAWKERRELSIADVLQADKDVKELCKLLEDGAGNISEQVKAIEQETKDLCLNLLVQERLLTWAQLGVASEFCKATVDDLVKLGSVTSKGCLTKAAITEIENRCKQDKAQQDKIASRLMELENRCLRAEILPPLSPASIASFLHADDAVFFGNLDKIVNAEIDRKAEAEERLRRKLEAEKQQAIDDALREQQAEANRLANEQAQKEAGARHEAERKAAQERDAIEAAQRAVPDEKIAEAKRAVAGRAEETERPPPAMVEPENQADYTVNVTYRRTEAFLFRTKTGTSEDKIKNYFRNKVVAQGVAEDDILVVEIVEHERN